LLRLIVHILEDIQKKVPRARNVSQWRWRGAASQWLLPASLQLDEGFEAGNECGEFLFIEIFAEVVIIVGRLNAIDVWHLLNVRHWIDRDQS
jgi:hypothetical protein